MASTLPDSATYVVCQLTLPVQCSDLHFVLSSSPCHADDAILNFPDTNFIYVLFLFVVRHSTANEFYKLGQLLIT